MKTAAYCGSLIFCSLFISGCSLGYISTSAWRQAKILFNREPLEEAANNPELSSTERDLLTKVPAIRSYAAEQLRLNVGESYSKYAIVPREALSWIVMGARKDRFELRTWWFPIVGTVPYKGFTTEKNARDGATELEREGYETWVRPAGAFSTLGWFNDPVVPSMLQDGEITLTNTLIHELSHRSFWIKNEVAFNESMANVIGTIGAVEYFSYKRERCGTAQLAGTCGAEVETLLGLACEDLKQREEIALAIDELFNRLSSLYETKPPNVIEEREKVFVEWKSRHGTISKNWATLNNARLMQAKIYYTRFNEMMKIVRHIGIPDTIRELHDVSKPWDWLDAKLTQAIQSNNFESDLYANVCR